MKYADAVSALQAFTAFASPFDAPAPIARKALGALSAMPPAVDPVLVRRAYDSLLIARRDSLWRAIHKTSDAYIPPLHDALSHSNSLTALFLDSVMGDPRDPNSIRLNRLLCAAPFLLSIDSGNLTGSQLSACAREPDCARAAEHIVATHPTPEWNATSSLFNLLASNASHASLVALAAFLDRYLPAVTDALLGLASFARACETSPNPSPGLASLRARILARIAEVDAMAPSRAIARALQLPPSKPNWTLDISVETDPTATPSRLKPTPPFAQFGVRAGSMDSVYLYIGSGDTVDRWFFSHPLSSSARLPVPPPQLPIPPPGPLDQIREYLDTCARALGVQWQWRAASVERNDLTASARKQIKAWLEG